MRNIVPRRIPRPGIAVRGSRTGRPIMVLLDLLGRRWVLRIMWELREFPFGFRELQSLCDQMSPSVLSQRLDELSQAGIVQISDGCYELTSEGRVLLETLSPLNSWAVRWAGRTKQVST
jgi:DNA-binding HxlR family transcriptional regulator